MALNVPLSAVESWGNERRVPQPFPGELIVLSRSGMECELYDDSGRWKSVKGTLYLTSLRLVFVVSSKDLPKSRFESAEFPLQGIHNEQLKQPIFGCNHLALQCHYVSSSRFLSASYFLLLST